MAKKRRLSQYVVLPIGVNGDTLEFYTSELTAPTGAQVTVNLNTESNVNEHSLVPPRMD